MAVKSTTWRIKGMNRDADPLVFSNEFAYENRNIRITASSDSTLLGITNIKGTEKIQNVTLIGTPIGTATISRYLVIFTTTYKKESNNPEQGSNNGPDFIYRIEFKEDNSVECITIAYGNFNFCTKYPIETIPYWEAEDVINIYWTDRRNQIRKINIVDNNIFPEEGEYKPITSVDKLDFITSFDSAPITEVDIKKQYSIGSFPSGIIQYFITAYNKFGNETNILYESPLYYMSPDNRGGTTEESNSNSFRISIKVSNQLNEFSYLRVYSTHRTTLNAEVAAYIVSDIKLKGVGEYTIVDTGHGLESIDPTSLLYKEREPFSAGTFAQKDNVLFVGDITLLGDNTDNFLTIRKLISNHAGYEETHTEVDYYPPSGVYPYESNLDDNNLQLKGFKCNDIYRLGIQLQRKTGEWTSVIPLTFGDNNYIRTSQYPNINFSENKLEIPKINIKLTNLTELQKELTDYISVRAVIAEPILGHKSILCQGILCPTLFNIKQRLENTPNNISSWFFRPMGKNLGNYKHNEEIEPGFSVEVRSKSTSTSIGQELAEIQNSVNTKLYINSYKANTELLDFYNNSTNYLVDQNILTFHSPDINDATYNIFANSKYNIRIIGVVPITASSGSYSIQTSSNTINPAGMGVLNKSFITDNIAVNVTGLVSEGLYSDSLRRNVKGEYKTDLLDFHIYPWHRNGSLNNDRNLSGTEVSQSALLKRKIFANLKYSYFTLYFNDIKQKGKDVKGIELSEDKINLSLYNSNEAESIRINNKYQYFGNVDMVLSWQPLAESGAITTRGDTWVSYLTTGYPITVRESTGKFKGYENALGTSTLWDNVDKEYRYGVEPVSLKFKSTPHLVLQLPSFESTKNFFPDRNEILPAFGDINIPSGGDNIEINYVDSKLNYNIISALFIAEPLKWTRTEDGLYFVCNTNKDKTAGSGYFVLVKDGVQTGFEAPHYNQKINQGDRIVTTSVFTNIPNAVIMTGYRDEMDKNDRVIQFSTIHKNDDYYQQTIGLNHNVEDTDYTINLPTNDYITSVISGYTPMMYLAEIYDSGLDSEAIYGTDDSNIRWNVASEPVPLEGTSDISIIVSGDTYFQRWDCLKTYPFTSEDQNSVVEILSFMVETQNNIAARTDRNRGIMDNTPMSPQNFNLYNEVYNQSQDFISSVYLEDSNLKNSNFPNTIYWSLSKTLREEIDTWTAITLSNSLDMDGDKGKVNAIRRYNNNLLVFQDTGLAQVLYNENMQIASTTGVPIEIANSGLVSGKRYISNTIGCENKWTIITGEESLYFMDSFNKGIYKYDGNLTNLTSSLGFNSWADNIAKGKWLPEGNGDKVFLAGYDKQNKEVHFMNKGESLVYSEQLGLFMSFMDIKNTPFISNVEDRVIAINDEAGTYSLYKMNTGEYSSFFGVSYPFFIQVIANPEPTLDKIFNVLEFRADCLDDNYKSIDNLNGTAILPFNKFNIWNEYQDSGNVPLQFKNGRPSNLKKKFRIWRINDFRNSGRRDRIRNPWVFFKLTNDEKKNTKVTLHDMIMYYFA